MTTFEDSRKRGFQNRLMDSIVLNFMSANFVEYRSTELKQIIYFLNKVTYQYAKSLNIAPRAPTIVKI